MKKTLVFLLCLLLIASPSWAVLSVDASTPHQQDAGADPWAFNHITAASANLLVVGCYTSSNAAGADIVGITYNSVALTPAIYNVRTTTVTVAIFYLVSPASGTNEVSVDTSGSTVDGGCYARTYIGADTSTPISATSGAAAGFGTDAGISNDITCLKGNQVFSIVGISANNAITADGGQTEVMNESDGAGQYAVSTEPGAAGTVTSGYSFSPNSAGAHAMACVQASVAVSSQVIIVE